MHNILGAALARRAAPAAAHAKQIKDVGGAAAAAAHALLHSLLAKLQICGGGMRCRSAQGAAAAKVGADMCGREGASAARERFRNRPQPNRTNPPATCPCRAASGPCAPSTADQQAAPTWS